MVRTGLGVMNVKEQEMGSNEISRDEFEKKLSCVWVAKLCNDKLRGSMCVCKFCAVSWAGGGSISEQGAEDFEGEVPLKGPVQSTAW